MGILPIHRLNEALSYTHNDARIAHILNTYRGKTLITTSFGTTSALLLHMISRIRPNHPIHFIDTGYLFPETLEYKDLLIDRFGLNIITISPDPEDHTVTNNNKTWQVNPDLCCFYNKVKPLHKITGNFDVWISGLIGFQNSFRTGLDIVQVKENMFRYYPLIDWSKHMVDEYFDFYNLPRHPLESQGFDSLGCTHCTVKGTNREGRWASTDKNECGLHTI